MGNIQWKMYLFPNYSEEESVFVWKVHHGVTDGIAIILMYICLTDEPDFKDFPPIMVRFPPL